MPKKQVKIVQNSKTAGHSVLRFILSLSIFLTIFLLGVDSFRNPDRVRSLIGIHSHQLVIPTILISLLYRLKVGIFFGEPFKHGLLIALISGVLWTSSLTFYEALTYDNAAFALTNFHLSQVWLLTVFVGVVFFINQPTVWWQENWKKVVLLVPFIGFFMALVTSHLPFDVFPELVKEDHLIEYGQFWILFLGSVGSFSTALQLKRANHKKWFVFFGFCALAFLLVAGDEIAWGQRLLGLDVNETVKSLNRQNELTVHNLYAVDWLVIYAYLSLSVLGLLGKWIAHKLAFLQSFTEYFSDRLLMGYFLFSLMFFTAQIIFPKGIWHVWSEVAELYLYSGLVLWILLLGKKKLLAA